MGEAFPELKREQQLAFNVIREEENSFLKTLDQGLILLESILAIYGPYESKASWEIPMLFAISLIGINVAFLAMSKSDFIVSLFILFKYLN
jgi:hypothetical protein